MYDNELELTVAKILFNNQHLLDYELLDMRDFFSDIKFSISNMVKIRKNGGIIDKVTIGRDFGIPSKEEVDLFYNYVKSLKSLSLERKLQDYPHYASLVVTGGDKKFKTLDSNEKIDELIKKLESYRIHSKSYEDYMVKNMIDEYMKKVKEHQMETLFPTLIKELDETIGSGVSLGNLVYIAGDTGEYKSTLARNIALRNALAGVPVMFISYEMDEEELMSIFISMIAEINNNVLRTGKMNNEKGELIPFTENQDVVNKLDNATKIFKELPICLITDYVSLNDIKLHALKMQPKMIFIDYIGLMPDIGDNEASNLPRISRTLKMFASKNILNCVIFALYQFKKGDDDNFREKELRDMKYDKGNDANLVLFTKRKESTDVSTGKANYHVQISIKKQRAGEAGGKIVLPIIPKWGKIMD